MKSVTKFVIEMSLTIDKVQLNAAKIDARNVASLEGEKKITSSYKKWIFL